MILDKKFHGSSSHTGEGAGGGDEVVRRHHALADAGRRCSALSGCLILAPPHPCDESDAKHAQIQEADSVASPFWRK